AIRQLSHRRAQFQIPDLEPRRPFRRCGHGRRGADKERDRKACNTTTRHGEITRETPQNHSKNVHRRRNILAALLLALSPMLAMAQGASEFLSGATKSCPGCSLEHAPLKRRDLTDADLTGANLAGAVLHRARLARAKLTGANLTDANLNKTD